MKHNESTVHPHKEFHHGSSATTAEAQTLIAGTLEHTTEALHHLRARFDAAQEHFADMYENANKKVVSGAKITDAAIHEHPYLSLAIAFKVGLILGALGVLATRRRK
jgi:ElaB/YqjD/DUF883 family membrane-anchored ribosome-binding protein